MRCRGAGCNSATLQEEVALEGITPEAIEEIEALRAIFGDEIVVQRGSELRLQYPVCISIACKPNTGGNAAQMFVQVRKLRSNERLTCVKVTRNVVMMLTAGRSMHLCAANVPSHPA
jgi:hypothetical protein